MFYNLIYYVNEQLTYSMVKYHIKHKNITYITSEILIYPINTYYILSIQVGGLNTANDYSQILWTQFSEIWV